MTALPILPPLPPGALRARLRSLSLLDANGADAREFLHGQLSSDVKALAVGGAQYASYNSPKGRMLATFVVWRRADAQFTLAVASDLAAAIARRLSMFVLRANVRFDVRTHSPWGILGADATAAMGAAFGSPLPAFASMQRADLAAAVLRLPDGRHLIDAGDTDTLPSVIAELPGVAETAWQWCGIHAGVPVVTAATSDQLIAQSANWELLGGVDFRKGCYPGQEIIARMQYLGKLKERLHAFHADADATALAAGTALHVAARDGAVGIVVNSAPSPAGGSDLLAVVQNDAVDDATLAAGAITLSPRALPYAVPALANSRVKL